MRPSLKSQTTTLHHIPIPERDIKDEESLYNHYYYQPPVSSIFSLSHNHPHFQLLGLPSLPVPATAPDGMLALHVARDNTKEKNRHITTLISGSDSGATNPESHQAQAPVHVAPRSVSRCEFDSTAPTQAECMLQSKEDGSTAILHRSAVCYLVPAAIATVPVSCSCRCDLRTAINHARITCASP